MSLLHEPTPAEKRRSERERLIKDVAQAANNLAVISRNAYQKFWSAEPVQLVADLNENLTSSLLTMQANAAIAAAVNAQLDLINLPQYTIRIPSALPPHISFDGKHFIYISPPDPEIFEESEI